MTRVEISVSPELQAFFRFTGDGDAHKASVDLDCTLRKIVGFNESDGGTAAPFDAAALLEHCTVVRRSAAPTEAADGRSEIERLRMQAEERRYQKNLLATGTCGSGATVAGEVKEMREAYLLAANFFMSFFGSFLFGFFSTQLFLQWPTERCVFAGVLCAVVVLGVEAALFVIRDERKRETLRLAGKH